MSVLYYVPGGPTASAELLRSVELAHVADGPFEHRGVGRGPDGGAGCVVARPSDSELGYFSDRQSWMQVGAYWVGWPAGAPPGPAEFARSKLLPGHWVTLGDGRQWLAPVAIAIDLSGAEARRAYALPWVSVRTETGWVRRCQERYQPLLDLALAVWERVSAVDSNGRVILATEGAEDEAVRALSANYHIGADEASALGLLTDDAIVEILMALIDGPSWRAEKKTDPVGGRTAPGGAG